MKTIIEIIELDVGYWIVYSDASIEYLTKYELEERIKKAA